MNLNERLFDAVKAGDVVGVREAIQNGADVNIRTTDNDTLLHIAAFRGCLEIVELLVECGLDVNARDRRQWTPLHDAVFRRHVETVELLVRKGADVNAGTENNWTALDLVMSDLNRNVRILQLLWEGGAQLNALGNIWTHQKIEELLRESRRMAGSKESAGLYNYRTAFGIERTFGFPRHQRNPEFANRRTFRVA